MSEISLGTIGLMLLLLTMVFRIFMVGSSLRKFSKMFEGKKDFKDGIKLFRYLEIPGLEQFVKQEFLFTILPYTALSLVLIFTPASEVVIGDLNLLISIICFLIVMFWAILDMGRSYLINRKLEAVRKETSVLRTISGNVLDGLKYVVYLRGSVPRTAVSLGKRALVGVAKGKVKESTKETKKKPFGIAALIALEKMISFPERVIGKITDWGKDAIDEKLKNKFERYSKRSKIRLFIMAIWSLVPSIIILLLTLFNA